MNVLIYRQKDTTPMSEYALIDKNIYIGEANSVLDEEFLRGQDIAFVVNASNDPSINNRLGIPGFYIGLEDNVLPPDPNKFRSAMISIMNKAHRSAKIIQKYAENGKSVLIHCQSGINRSAFIIAHYLIIMRNYSAETAIAMIRKINREHRRIPALTNDTYVSLLECDLPVHRVLEVRGLL